MQEDVHFINKFDQITKLIIEQSFCLIPLLIASIHSFSIFEKLLIILLTVTKRTAEINLWHESETYISKILQIENFIGLILCKWKCYFWLSVKFGRLAMIHWIMFFGVLWGSWVFFGCLIFFAKVLRYHESKICTRICSLDGSWLWNHLQCRP